MPDTITDPYAEKEAQLNQRRLEACSRYPDLWSEMISEWKSPGSEDRAWLMYSANYLFRTNNIRWAIDPLQLSWRMTDAPKIDAARELSDLSFALLTHRHADHLDLDLISALRHLPITWVVPEFLLSIVTKRAGLPCMNIIVPALLQPIELHGMHILPFKGLHWEKVPGNGRKGVPALGYLIEYNGKRWLFPGDTRTYDPFWLPDFGSVDHLFAHLWLGRGCALMEESLLTDAFCQFFLCLRPVRITLTHLNELGRNANELWDESHARKVRERFQALSPNVLVHSAQMGESVLL